MTREAGAEVLAVDLGKTGCRVALWTAGSRTDAEGIGAPGLAVSNGAALAEAAILAVAAPLLRAAGLVRLQTMGVGVAGALAMPEAARELAGRLCVSLAAGAVAVASDAITSHAGALGGEAGVVLAVGTGVVVLAIGPDRVAHRADGWGPWLGDEGGGAWIGLHGLRAALRAADGRGPPTLLQAATERRFGPFSGLAGQIASHDSPPRLAATFAPDVAQAAQAGDAVAAALLREAAGALAATVRAAASRLTGTEPVPLAIVGGLAGLGSVLLDPLLQALHDGAPLLDRVAAQGTALDGARLLALGTDTLHEHCVIRATAAG